MTATLTRPVSVGITRQPQPGEIIVPTRDPDEIFTCDGCLNDVRYADTLTEDGIDGVFCSEDCLRQAIEDGAEWNEVMRAYY